VSAPSGISLQPNQFIVQPSDTGLTSITNSTISTGFIVQAYSKQMAFNEGDNVTYSNEGAVYFQWSGQTYIFVKQDKMLFKTAAL